MRVLLLLLLLWFTLVDSHAIWGPLITSSVTARSGRKGSSRRSDHDAPVDISNFDTEGELPMFKTAKRLLSKASPIVAIRFCEMNETQGRKLGNGTLLAWGYDLSSPFEIRLPTQCLTTLGHPFQRMLITGIAGDCRAMSRFVKQTALNHTLEYDESASGAFLADRMAEFMQSCAQGERPLVCHAFICSGIDGSLYSIDSSCVVAQVQAGAAGREAVGGRIVLERNVRENTTFDEAISIARRVVNPPFLVGKMVDLAAPVLSPSTPVSNTTLPSNETTPLLPVDSGTAAEEDSRHRELGLEYCIIYDVE